MASVPLTSTDTLRLVAHGDWLRRAEAVLPTDIAPFVVKSGDGKLRIAPGLCRQRRVLVLGHDWLPILADGSFTLEGMVHTPARYAGKIRNLERTGEQTWRPAFRQRHRLVEPAVLVGGSRNYYHWLINHLPRLLWLERRGLLAGRRILVNDRMTLFQRESLAALGIDPLRCYELADTDAVDCDDLLVPDFFAANTVTHPAAVAMLRAAYLPRAVRPRAPARRVLLSRRDASNRRLHNEAQAMALASAAGFQVFTLGGMPFVEQVGLFAGAEAVLAVHGAGLTNLLFCPPGSQVIEVALPGHRVSFMHMLSRVCGHQHHFVDAAIDGPASEVDPLMVDWWVDEAALARQLGRFMPPG